jgi:hypothetical protein
MKLFAETTLSVVSETTAAQPFSRTRVSTARKNRNCRPLPQWLLNTPTRETYPALRTWVEAITPANPTAMFEARHGRGVEEREAMDFGKCVRDIFVLTIDCSNPIGSARPRHASLPCVGRE